ncbi:hypothetical protein LDENG_00242130 [Lucifuga dentata]|nr:hypothetical protein LDENG_00242130 [Lucifuga dentata]
MFHLFKCLNVQETSILVNFPLKDHTGHFACLSLIYSVFIHVTLHQSFPKAYYWNDTIFFCWIDYLSQHISCLHTLIFMSC